MESDRSPAVWVEKLGVGGLVVDKSWLWTDDPPWRQEAHALSTHAKSACQMSSFLDSLDSRSSSDEKNRWIRSTNHVVFSN